MHQGIIEALKERNRQISLANERNVKHLGYQERKDTEQDDRFGPAIEFHGQNKNGSEETVLGGDIRLGIDL